MKKKTINGKVYVITPEEQEGTCFGCAFDGHFNEAPVCPYMQSECKNGMIFKALETEETKKSNLKPFNLEEAKAGKSVCTRDGHKARIICFDAEGNKPLIVLSKINGQEIILRYTEKGQSDNFHSPTPREDDLMMLPEKKEGWIIKPKDYQVYQSKEDAEEIYNKNYQVVAKITWEE